MTVGLIPRMDPGPINVLTVTAGSPASRAGLKAGDQIVVSINDLQPHSVYALLAFLKDNKGAPDTLGVLRNGQPLTLTPRLRRWTPRLRRPIPPRLHLSPATGRHRAPPRRQSHPQSIKDNREGSMLILRVSRASSPATSPSTR
jgi:regulator of sigma E protease